jgi:multidrug efflux pump subunit AcrA (membrane-fusion protein)
VIIGLLVVAAAGVIGWLYFKSAGSEDAENLIVRTVTRGPFEHIVLEQGQVESAVSVELKCEVESRSPGGGTEILWVIDEGTHVKRGDKLVELDSSSLEQELVQQQIVCNTSRAAVIQAKNTLEAAQIARTEYLEGAYRQEEQMIQSEIFVAEENLRRAQLAFQSTERLAAKGIVTSLQLEGDQFAVDKAKNELEAAETKLEVLQKYTKEKMLKQFDSDIAIAEAQLDSETKSKELEDEKLLDVELQIEHCTIVLGEKAIIDVDEETGEKSVRRVEDPDAPEAGQVVYANKYSSRGGNAEFVVEAGATVRERQAIIRLPDRDNMQVKATVNESRISLIRQGLPVQITLDAVKDRTLKGTITKVNQYAEPGSWSSGNIKEYAAFIEIHDPPSEIRTGMNAEVRIFVEDLKGVLQVPVQALYETKGHFFCLVKDGETFVTREVQVGSSNDSFMTVESGLEEGETVVMNPRAHADKLEIPDLPDEEPVEAADGPTGSPGGPGAGSAERPEGGPGVEGRRGGPGRGARGGPDGAAGGPPAGRGGRGEGAGGGGFDPAAIFAQRDTDGDGVISADEMSSVPAGFRDRMIQNDTDGDGAISRDEFMKGMSRFQGGGRPPQGSRGGGGQ